MDDQQQRQIGLIELVRARRAREAAEKKKQASMSSEVVRTVEQTSGFGVKYKRLNNRLRRKIDESIRNIRENPTDFQGRITQLSGSEDEHGFRYRYRCPGAHIIYIVHDNEQKITLVQLNVMGQ